MAPYRRPSGLRKGKARGGKRHLRRLQRAGLVPGELCLSTLQKQHYSYQKLGLAPWHWHHRQPPCLVRQLAAQHLLTTFFAWQRQLPDLAEPSYFAIWLVGPEFAHSSRWSLESRIA